MKKLITAMVFVSLLWPHVVFAESQTATYQVTFTATWSNQTHPHPNFPATAHFSPLIGGIHNADVKFWEVGVLASPGIEAMAEDGLTNPLTAEVNTAIGNEDALAVLSRPGGIPSPGSATITSFQVTKDFPLVTLVTMIAPTPDWFTGVSGLSLLDDQGEWVASKVVTLYPYDAGTEQGSSFSLSNPPTDPPEPIFSISGVSPFSTQPVGVFTFTRINYSDLNLSKTVGPETNVTYHGLVTYTIVLSNNGDTKASGAVLTDTLPANVTFANWLQRPSGANQSSNQITWTGAVTASKAITFSFVATHTGVAYSETITNTAVYSHASGSGQASASFTIQDDPNQGGPIHDIYLPILLKGD